MQYKDIRYSRIIDDIAAHVTKGIYRDLAFVSSVSNCASAGPQTIFSHSSLSVCAETYIASGTPLSSHLLLCLPLALAFLVCHARMRPRLSSLRALLDANPDACCQISRV